MVAPPHQVTSPRSYVFPRKCFSSEFSPHRLSESSATQKFFAPSSSTKTATKGRSRPI
jgi:hypothetical protein